MIFIIKEIRKFLQSHFVFWAYFATISFAAILVAINYYFKLDESWNNSYRYSPWIYLITFVRNIIAYFGTLAIVFLIGKKKVNKPKEFFIISILGVLFYSFYSKFYGYISIVENLNISLRFYFHYIFANIQGLITLIVPLLVIWKFQYRNQNYGFYGLNFKALKPKRYLDVFIIILLIVFFATMFGSITEYYPLLKYTLYKFAASHFEVSNIVTIAGFELSYALDFVIIEIFFRGFLILGLVKYLGKDAILPMITLYTVIHFGKPLPETISSLFGGYILGVIAYSQKHIRAGIVFHLALALGMELFAYLLIK